MPVRVSILPVDTKSQPNMRKTARLSKYSIYPNKLCTKIILSVRTPTSLKEWKSTKANPFPIETRMHKDAIYIVTICRNSACASGIIFLVYCWEFFPSECFIARYFHFFIPVATNLSFYCFIFHFFLTRCQCFIFCAVAFVPRSFSSLLCFFFQKNIYSNCCRCCCHLFPLLR